MSSYDCSSEALDEYSMVYTTLTVAGLIRSAPVIGRLHCSHMAVGYTEVKLVLDKKKS